MRILIIDDEPMLAAALQRVLARASCDSVFVTSGRAGLEAVLADEPDLILCDLGLPDLPGLGLLEALELQRPELIPRLIFMTGGAPSAREAAAIARHGLVVLEKPFSPAELLALVAR
ncbi:MAG: response regulator [Myxococcales bacterium]|nr:MAG: response regulator [Myxococcales bacterium]